MAVEKQNVLIGKCTLSVDSVDVGFTVDGVRIRLEREYVDIEADQLKGIVDKKMIMEKLFVETTLLEGTLANLRKVWDQPAANLSGSGAGSLLALGSESGNVEHTLSLTEVPGESSNTRTITIHRAVSIDAGEYMIGRGEPARIPVTFECLKDSANNNNFGNIVTD